MDERRRTKIRRRDLLLVVAASTAAVAACESPMPSARSEAAAKRDKSKPQYEADSAQVQAYYRVNRYPAKG